MITPEEMAPNLVVTLHYRCRELGYGVEEGTVAGFFTGEVTTVGHYVFRLLDPSTTMFPDATTLYLFPDELVEVTEGVDL